MRHQTFLISAFPKGKFGRLLGSKCANKPADSNFPLSVIMHFNEVDGLMLHFSNRPLGDHQLSLLCFISAQLIASVLVTHKIALLSTSIFHLLVFMANGPPPPQSLCKMGKLNRNHLNLRLNG